MNGLRIRGLVKRYPQTTDFLRWLVNPFERKTRTALDGVDLDLEPGRIYGLVGHNGAGKTTLMKMVAGLVLPTEGTITYRDEEYSKNAAGLRQKVGMVVAEERSFFWRISLVQNLRFFATLENLKGQERETRIARVLEEVGLAEHADRLFKDLSTGMRQRMCIARGLLAAPPILLLDEPTRSLDPAAAREVRDRLKELVAADPTRIVLYSSHVLSEIEDLCTDVFQIEQGKLIGAWNLDEIDLDAQRTHYSLRTERAIDPAWLTDLKGVEILEHEDSRMRLELSAPIPRALDRLVDRLREHEATLVELQPDIDVEDRVLAALEGRR